MDYRVEKKYFITESAWGYLKSAVQEICRPDSHHPDGTYLIRSVYFDDMYDSCLQDNEDGNDHREKFRIRTYNCSDETIRLELKGKEKGFTWKRHVNLTKEEADRLLKGDYLTDFSGAGHSGQRPERPLLNKLSAEIQTRGMHPVVLIEYERTAYIYDVGNVRITFDHNIGSRRQVQDFWNGAAAITPVLPAGVHVLEVKYDELLPDFIRQILLPVNLQRMAFSKYYYGRIGL